MPPRLHRPARRCHRHLVRACDHLPWQPGDALREAIGAIRRAIAIGTWTPQQRQRLRQLAPATWQQALDGALAACPGRPDDSRGHSLIEIAIYPDVVWLAARILQDGNCGGQQAP
jgi:hypothetical protein